MVAVESHACVATTCPTRCPTIAHETDRPDPGASRWATGLAAAYCITNNLRTISADKPLQARDHWFFFRTLVANQIAQQFRAPDPAASKLSECTATGDPLSISLTPNHRRRQPQQTSTGSGSTRVRTGLHRPNGRSLAARPEANGFLSTASILMASIDSQIRNEPSMTAHVEAVHEAILDPFRLKLS